MRGHFTDFPSRASTTTIYHKIFKIKCDFYLLPTLSTNPSQGDAFFTGLVTLWVAEDNRIICVPQNLEAIQVWEPCWDGAVGLSSLVAACA